MNMKTIEDVFIHLLSDTYSALMNPLMIFIKIIKLR